MFSKPIDPSETFGYWKDRAQEWERLVADLFHGEESPVWHERSWGMVCSDCGRTATADVSDIEHEDGCVIGPLYAMLTHT